MNAVVEEIRKLVPGNAKLSPQHWLSMNCPCCVAAGESRPDTRSRGGMNFSISGGVIYHCFNCKTTGSWEPGLLLSSKMEFILSCFGLSRMSIEKIAFKAWQIKQTTEYQKTQQNENWADLEFKEIALPKGAMTFSEVIESNKITNEFLNAAKYVDSRGPGFLNGYDYYWSPEYKNGLRHKVIIPFFWKNKTVGWITRSFNERGYRYHGDIPTNFLFNNNMLYDRSSRFVFLVEGIFDAIGLRGVAALGTSLSTIQRQWINSSGKDVILVPDRDKAGQPLIDIAINEGWDVAFPGTMWEEDIKDAADAIKRYGRIYTLKTILDNRESNKVAINVKRKKFDN